MIARTTTAAAMRKISKGPGTSGGPTCGVGCAVGASAVAVLATASSSSARAVPVAAAAVSISGGIVAVPPDPVEVGLGVCPTVEVALDVGLGRILIPVEVAALVVGVRVGVLVGVRVEVGGLGVFVLEEVGLGPDVEVRVGVRVGVRVAVFVADPLDVSVTLGVADAGGAFTVNDPGSRVSGTLFPSGSLAAVLTRPRLKVPAVAPASTSNETEAIVPSGIAF